MTVLGLTGGSGVGKTTVMQVWAGRGAVALDADDLYHGLLREDAALLNALQAAFPDAFASGQLDRKVLGRMVFAERARQKELERITHPAVVSAVERELDAARRQGRLMAVVEALYLLETPLRHRFSAVVGVIAPREQRIARIAARDGVSRAYAAARIDAQPDDAYYRARCDIILENDAEPEALVKRAGEIYGRFDHAQN